MVPSQDSTEAWVHLTFADTVDAGGSDVISHIRSPQSQRDSMARFVGCACVFLGCTCARRWGLTHTGGVAVGVGNLLRQFLLGASISLVVLLLVLHQDLPHQLHWAGKRHTRLQLVGADKGKRDQNESKGRSCHTQNRHRGSSWERLLRKKNKICLWTKLLISWGKQ